MVIVSSDSKLAAKKSVPVLLCVDIGPWDVLNTLKIDMNTGFKSLEFRVSVER